MVLRRSFINGIIASICGFLGIDKVFGGTVPNGKYKTPDPVITNEFVLNKKQSKKIDKNLNYSPWSSHGDRTLNTSYGDTVECKLNKNKLIITKGNSQLIIDKDKSWKSNWGPLFEFVEPSVYITLNPDGTINNIYSPQNLGIVIAKHNGHGGLESVNVKSEYNVRDEDRNGSTVELYPNIEDDKINVIQERYLSLEDLKKDKKITETAFEKCDNGWNINAMDRVRIKKDGIVYNPYLRYDGKINLEEENKEDSKSLKKRMNKNNLTSSSVLFVLKDKDGKEWEKAPLPIIHLNDDGTIV